jgi:protocatechuate 3,4-dioxygenase beta subunit
MTDPTEPDRRDFLLALSASPFVLTGVGVFASATRATAQAAGLIAPNVCLVTPELTAGPFYLEHELDRGDIAEGRPGAALSLRLQVVTADCAPVPGARVAIWHCDAAGNYSGYPGQGSDRALDTSGQTFLRGSQRVDGTGTAQFRTIYPGWYRGRTTHIHVKVFLGDRTALTSQIFFPDALSEYLYRFTPPYDARGSARDTMNADDRIARSAGAGAYALIREEAGGYDAALVVGIDPGA